jgi:hypothetical protein
LDAVIDGTINRYVCRRCSHVGVADAPVVVFGALEAYPVIVSPVGSTLGDTERSVAGYFIQELGERLGDPGLLGRMAARMPEIPRAQLGSALRSPPRNNRLGSSGTWWPTWFPLGRGT